MNQIWRADLKLKAGMEVFTGRLLEEGCIRLLGHQSDGHDQSLVGMQETRTEFGLSSSFKNRRNGYHVLPTATETYTHSRSHWIWHGRNSNTEDYAAKTIITRDLYSFNHTPLLFVWTVQVNLRSCHCFPHTHPAEEDTQGPCPHLKPRTTHD